MALHPLPTLSIEVYNGDSPSPYHLYIKIKILMNYLYRIISVLITFLLFNTHISVFAQPLQVTSPDGSIKLFLSETYPIEYSISVSGSMIISKATAALYFNEPNNPHNPITIKNIKRSSQNRLLTPHIKQKSAQIVEHYNQITLIFDNQQTVNFRVFNSGIAYRFNTFMTDHFAIKNELAQFKFIDSTRTLFPAEKSFVSHNERTYESKQLSAITENEFASLPLMVEFNKSKLVITESGLKDYPGMWLQGTGRESLRATFPKTIVSSKLQKGSDRNEVIEQRSPFIFESKLAPQANSRSFPWRILAISKDDSELLTNQLSYLLADELAINPSWVKPGQVAWDWWNANNVYGVDFIAGINTQTYKYYIDFAAKNGIEYIILDEGWHHLDSVMNVVEDIDVKEIIAYGKLKNVDVILWVIWKTLDTQLTEALDLFAHWGAAGIKVDFMQRDDQAMVNYYWKIARETAKRKLLVNFHGSYKPAGLRRAYPNVITREGVRGLEHNKWANYITAEHNLTLPFIRQVAGPMDYTPGAMSNAQPNNFSISFARPMSKTTRAHQVAMYIVYESPLQMLADSPSAYVKESQTTEFITAIPTVWDETHVISAKLADHIVIARRNGTQWYLGAMGNSNEHKINVDLSFLPANKRFEMTLFKDGLNADKFASDHKIETKPVTHNSTFILNLAPSGGAAAIIKEAQ